ncbi:L-asparaginase, type II [Klebsiella pneumoniae]|uniref:L-asparaginase, type II n=1 Tax=Klebsiella pneumoniae TaxID=573 RepID=A0A2X3F4F3_KLEPN|nr:L-asparaginase, type II [Klebsiella pneumoniae]
MVVRASRTGSGVVPPDDSQPGLVADSLNPAKARILLMTALTQTKRSAADSAIFPYLLILCGEGVVHTLAVLSSQ